MKRLMDFFREKTLAIIQFSIYAISILLVIILSFSFMFYFTQSIGFSDGETKLSLGHSLYFTMTSFITIGYGDIFPINELGRSLVFLESIISLFYSSAFAGFLVYVLLKKEKRMFSTKRLYIRIPDDKYFLSFKLGNKSNPIVGIRVTLEFLHITDERIRKRFYTAEKQFGIIEKILYVDFPVNARRIHAPLRDAIFGDRDFDIRVIVQGTDSVSGENVAFRKYYDAKYIRFGSKYKDVIFKWAKGRPENLKWENFNRIQKIDDKFIQKFRKLRLPK